MGVIELLQRGRVIELNRVIHPGMEERRLEIRRYRVEPGEFMYEVDTMSHIGTHAETPLHFMPALYEGADAKDIADYPPGTWMGEAVYVNLAQLPPRGKVTIDFLEGSGIRSDDIVLIGHCPYEGDEIITMTSSAARWLGEIGIRLLAMDFSYNIEEDFSSLDKMGVHLELLRRGIPLIEGLVNLGELRDKRVFFIGLPYRVRGCDAWPIRAIAIEGIL